MARPGYRSSKPYTVAASAHHLVKLLAYRLYHSQMSTHEFCTRAGIAVSTLYTWFSGKCDPGITKLDNCLRVLGMRVPDAESLPKVNYHGDSNPVP